MTTDYLFNKNPARSETASGFSLVELLISIALSAVLLLGVVSIYTNSKQTYNTQEGLSRLQENARFAMDRLTKEISSAGYMGCLPANSPIDPGNPNDPLGDDRITNTLTNQAPGTTSDYARPVFGTEGAANAPDTITLIRARGQTGIPVVTPMRNSTDSITLDSTHRDYPNLSQFDVVTLSDCSRSVTFMITNAPPAAPAAGVIQHATGVASPAPENQSNATTDLKWVFGAKDKSQAILLPVLGNTYSIGNSARGACSAATPGYCALLENGVELIEGVEDLQVLYGEDTTVPDPDSSVDIYRPANQVANWDNVVSVRITLTINEVEQVQGSGNGVTNPNTRRTYTNTIRIRSRGV